MTRTPSDQTRSPSDDIESPLRQLDGLERHLESLQTQAQQLQRLAALGTMSAMLAHEINNILTPIVSYCQYAADRDDPDLMRKAVEKTLTHARRLTTLCGRIMGLAAEDTMGPVDTALLPLIEDAVECLGRSPEKDNIELTLDVSPALNVHGHAGSIRQVLFNLVLNARQAILDRGGSSGRLTIAARQTDGNGIEIRVVDNGSGIRPEDLDKVFEPFFSTRRSEPVADRRGVGLGLTICRRLIEEQNGRITVTSDYGRGAAFTLTLPAGQTG